MFVKCWSIVWQTSTSYRYGHTVSTAIATLQTVTTAGLSVVFDILLIPGARRW